jgi:hypothetical protein
MFSPDAITPRHRLRSAHLTSTRQIDNARVPAYGLPPSWRGIRATGDTCFETGITRDAAGVSAEIHESVELMHHAGESVLRVESSDHVRPISDDALLELLDGAGTCGSMTISIDGRLVAFASAHNADRFVARWAGYKAAVTVVGERWPTATGLELVRITDFARYHEGRLRMLGDRSGYDLRD